MAWNCKSKSEVCKYSIKNENVEKAYCIECKNELSTKGGATGGVLRYPKSRNALDLLQKANAQPVIATSTSDQVKKNLKITHLLSADTSKDDEATLKSVLARMTSKDLIGFNTIAQSKHLPLGLLAREFNVAKSPNTIRSYIMRYAERIERKMASTLIDLRNKNERLSCEQKIGQ